MTFEYWLGFYHLLWPAITAVVAGGLIINAIDRRWGR